MAAQEKWRRDAPVTEPRMQTYNDKGRPAVRHHDRRLGHRRHAGRGGHRRADGLAGTQFRHSLAHVLAPAAVAHQCRGVRLRRLGAVRDLLLRRAAHLPCAAVLRRACGLQLLGLAGGDRRGGHHAAARDHHHQGVRRARMADRHFDYRGVGRLRDRVLRHARQAPREPHLRRQLVLRRVHPDHRPAARGQQPGAAGVVGPSRTRSMPACRTPWCSGGTVTTPWAFS